MSEHLEQLLGNVDLAVDNPVNLMVQLKQHEGVRLHTYRCTSGKLTIGVGRNLDGNGISESEADILLINDLASVVTDLRRNFPPRKSAGELCDYLIFNKLDDVRKTVLIDMCFNLGISRLLQFKKMFAAIGVKDWTLAADEMIDSRWCSQVGQRCETLRVMMETGRHGIGELHT